MAIFFLLSPLASAQVALRTPNSPFDAEIAASALPTPGVGETERIIVTGSNIPTADEVGANPVLTLDREAIDKAGERTAEELIRNLTVAGPNGVPTSNSATAPTAGASSISLRGFDPSDTLTLIDGRRVASYPVGANGTQSFVDLNSIPRAAIERIEILKDCASTTYGADAVAGVVNIKLRHDYRGAEANIEYGNTFDKDSGEVAASLLFGVGDQNTSLTGVLNYYHRNSIFNRDRGYSSVTKQLSSNTSPLNLQLARDAVLAAGVTLRLTWAIPFSDALHCLPTAMLLPQTTVIWHAALLTLISMLFLIPCPRRSAMADCFGPNIRFSASK